jgi:hypothetical protein
VLTQAEADALIQMPKRFVTSVSVKLPPGADHFYDLVGSDPRERFLLDLRRSRIRLSKLRYQTRARLVIVLVRLCLNGAPHPNPDGQLIGGTHLHIYREGYGDKWAFPLDPAQFADTNDMWRMLMDFCGYCQISPLPAIEPELV